MGLTLTLFIDGGAAAICNRASAMGWQLLGCKAHVLWPQMRRRSATGISTALRSRRPASFTLKDAKPH
jgi:hypothetical protein